MFGQYQDDEARAREELFLQAILGGTLADPEVDDPEAVQLADAIIDRSLRA